MIQTLFLVQHLEKRYRSEDFYHIGPFFRSTLNKKACWRKLELEGGALMRARSGLEKYLVETLDLSKHSGTQEPFLSELCSVWCVALGGGWRWSYISYFITQSRVEEKYGGGHRHITEG